MPQEAINEMVIRHDERLNDINGSIEEIKEEQRYQRRWLLAAAVGGMGSLMALVVQLLVMIFNGR